MGQYTLHEDSHCILNTYINNPPTVHKVSIKVRITQTYSIPFLTLSVGLGWLESTKSLQLCFHYEVSVFDYKCLGNFQSYMTHCYYYFIFLPFFTFNCQDNKYSSMCSLQKACTNSAAPVQSTHNSIICSGF